MVQLTQESFEIKTLISSGSFDFEISYQKTLTIALLEYTKFVLIED